MRGEGPPRPPQASPEPCFELCSFLRLQMGVFFVVVVVVCFVKRLPKSIKIGRMIDIHILTI